MPKTKRTRKYGNRKRKYASKKRHMTVTATRSLQPLPARFITKHKYSTPFTLNALNSYQYKFNLNSLYDPDYTGVGHQPYGRDQLAALYNRYRVIKTSWVINGIQTDSPGTNIRLACQPSNDIVSYGNISAMCEAPRTRFIVQGAQGAPLKILKGFSHLPTLCGRTTAEYMADDRYQADVNTSPPEYCMLNVMGSTLTDGSATINCDITLEFTVEWFDIQQQTQS